MMIRAYEGADEQSLLALWNETLIHDRIHPGLFHRSVLLDPNFVPDNLPLALEDGRIVGFVLALARQVPFFLQGLEPENAWITAFGVHPDYRRRGIGRALINHVLQRLARQGCKRVEIAPYEPNYFLPGVDVRAYSTALDFLTRDFGFEEVDRAISMGIDLSAFEISPETLHLERHLAQTAGVTVSGLASRHLPLLMPFLVRHFGWGWYQYIRSSLLDYFGAGAHPVGFFVAERGAEIVGFSHQRAGRFGPFGVRPDLRGQGIGRVLIDRCLEAMSARRIFYAYFLWAGEDSARLYARVGFKTRREFALLRKTLDG